MLTNKTYRLGAMGWVFVMGWMFVMGWTGVVWISSCSQNPVVSGESSLESTGSSDGGSADTTAIESAAAKQGAFVVVSYNVHGLASAITGDDTNKRLKQIGPLLDGYEIVGLQEVFTQEGYDNLKAGFNHPVQHWFPDTKEGKAAGSGLLLLSRFRAVEVKTEHYEFCHGTLTGAGDCFASKGFQMVRYELSPGVEVDVYNSHFEAGNGDEDRDARNKNLLKLRDTMLQWSKDRAIVFTGDTNLHEDREGDKKALDDWLKTVPLQDACEAVNCPKKGRIDRVLFRDGKTVTWKAISWDIPSNFVDADKKALSDHEPIVVKLEWRERQVP